MPEAAKCADSPLHSVCISEVRRRPIKGLAPLESTRIPVLQQPDHANDGAGQTPQESQDGSNGGASPPMHRTGPDASYVGRMARRVSRSQIQSQIRQVQTRQRQATNRYNSAIREFNRAVGDYNRKARAHNARMRANRARLQRELQRLSRTPPSTVGRYRRYHQSVTALQQSFGRLEATAEAGAWTGDDALFEMSEGEAANSVAALNALVTETPHVAPTEREIAELQATTLGDELSQIDPDLDERWRGALFALHPSNPDAGRHFCTSAREMLDTMLTQAATDSDVFAANPNAARTENGSPTRRSRVEFCLNRTASFDDSLAAFVDADIKNVMRLFEEFNRGTHGRAGRFDLVQLRAIKRRVEDAVRFVSRITG